MRLASIKTKDGIEYTVMRTVTRAINNQGRYIYTLVEAESPLKINRYPMVEEVEQVFLMISNLPIEKEEKLELIKGLLRALGVENLNPVTHKEESRPKRKYTGYTMQKDLDEYARDGFIRVKKAPHKEFTEKVEFDNMFTIYEPDNKLCKTAEEEYYNAGRTVIVGDFERVTLSEWE